MYMARIVAAAAAVMPAFVLAAPMPDAGAVTQSLNCNSLAFGLSSDSCQTMQKLNFKAAGINAKASGATLWIGKDGPNRLHFKNGASDDLTLVIWTPVGDDPMSKQSCAFCMNVRVPDITYSIAKGDTATISMANGKTAAWSTIRKSTKSLNKLSAGVENTWGEITTGAKAAVDASAATCSECDAMTIKVRQSSCVSTNLDGGKCYFNCANGVGPCTTGVKLINCEPNSQNATQKGTFEGADSGGCGGFDNGGDLDITLGDPVNGPQPSGGSAGDDGKKDDNKDDSKNDDSKNDDNKDGGNKDDKPVAGAKMAITDNNSAAPPPPPPPPASAAAPSPAAPSGGGQYDLSHVDWNKVNQEVDWSKVHY